MALRVLIACPHLQRELDQYAAVFRDRDIVIEAPPVSQQLSEEDLLGMIERFDGVVAGDDEFTSRVLARATRLRVISKWGIGLDNIDLTAARERGVVVMNTPGQLGIEVAEVALGYLVLLARQLHRIDRAVRDGDWKQLRGSTLAGKTLGIVGLGAAGRALAVRAAALGMTIIAHDPYLDPPGAPMVPETKMAALDEVLANADYLSLHCPLTSDNHHMLDAEAFAVMKPGVSIINTARGALIDEPALIKALKDGQVRGAALDVFEQEPLPVDSPLRALDQCILGSHNCSNTSEAVARVNALAVKNLLDGLLGARA